VSFVDVRDVAAVASIALTGDLPNGALTLTGSAAHTFDEAADMLARASGRAVRYAAITEDEMLRDMAALHWPDRQAGVAVRMFASVARGQREEVSQDIEAVLGRPPVAFDTFAREVAEALR
jgi:uncharacterized protein YbjT (DUF2867 family)